ncbi:PLP-dependent transferase [Patellaria atrata CBS 101060]|uniref:PLP-dependent transferase n=1 Tax=Patellaria atrata CBS 101060 TaxID=1346257 RepID=A0A9P4S8D4_9PEZI|nr:PLP-dependent transferase [Patellaria atrata CBS 101060]
MTIRPPNATNEQSLPVREKRLEQSISNGSRPTFGRAMRSEFMFDDDFMNLNHVGSFGTYPREIRNVLRHYQEKSEARPDQFIRYDYPKHLDESRTAIAKLLNVPVDTAVFVPNATTAVNTVLRGLTFAPNDRIIYFASIYGACEKVVAYITEITPAESIKIEFEHPVPNEWLVQEFRRVVQKEKSEGKNVKVAIFDVVSSMPGIRMPFEDLTRACRELGVLSCIDGAHGVGHVELDLGSLDPDFFVSNCHKWLFVPRGCAVFVVPTRNQELMRSTIPTSHGFTPKPRLSGKGIGNPLPLSNKSPFITNFEFVGTIDNSPYLCIPAGIEYRSSIGGEKAIRDYCFNLAKTAGQLLSTELGTEILEDEENHGNSNFSNVKLPIELNRLDIMVENAQVNLPDVGITVRDWLTMRMVREYSTFMALIGYKGAIWIRVSAQIYLELADFKWAAEILKELCGRVYKGEFLDDIKKTVS